MHYILFSARRKIFTVLADKPTGVNRGMKTIEVPEKRLIETYRQQFLDLEYKEKP
jgi:hypothetical protein